MPKVRCGPCVLARFVVAVEKLWGGRSQLVKAIEQLNKPLIHANISTSSTTLRNDHLGRYH